MGPALGDGLSANWFHCRVTTLIEINLLSTTPGYHTYRVDN